MTTKQGRERLAAIEAWQQTPEFKALEQEQRERSMAYSVTARQRRERLKGKKK